jgi:periplasmic protein TonB
MAEPLDILDDRDPLTGPFIGSLVFHLSVVALLFVSWLWMKRSHETLGEIKPAGGPAYAVSPVHTIPVPQRDAPPNPVAHDTKSAVPTAPDKEDEEKKLPVPHARDAFELPDKFKPKSERPRRKQQYTQPTPPNQIHSETQEAVSNPLYSMPSGGGQVGIGPNSPLGNRLGWYAELIRQRIAQNWRTNGLDARSQASPAIVNFTIARDGTIGDPKIVQSSGNPTIDNTALRAVYDSSRLPALPPQITENSISAQFTFNLR